MAKCDEGYLCEICGEDVAGIDDSDLYLRYVIGMIDPETLHITPEKHIRCNPGLAQFIIDAEFTPVFLDSAFSKDNLDREFVKDREKLVTRGWRRLQEIKEDTSELSILKYPLPEFQNGFTSETKSEIN